MKKTCNNCKALNYNNYCELGYKTERISIDFITIGSKPLENCPKPKTLKEYMIIWDNQNR